MRGWLMVLCGGAVWLAPPAAVTAQAVAQRVAAAPPDETLRFSYEARPGVCGDGENIMIEGAGPREGITIRQHGYDSHAIGQGRIRRDGRMVDCQYGPVRVELTRAAGIVTGARLRVGGAAPAVGTDLGTVSPAAAIEYLLSDAAQHASPRVADRLTLAATLANAESWPALLRVARSPNLDAARRRTALFWLGQAASDNATRGLTSVISDNTEDLELRKHALFALSQIKSDETIDTLMRIAKTHQEPELRRTAIFWLAQSRDPRVVEFFAELLRG